MRHAIEKSTETKMDPDNCLAHIRELISQYKIDEKNMQDGEKIYELEEMMAHFEDLDEWLTKGGFKPKSWLSRHDCQNYQLKEALLRLDARVTKLENEGLVK